MVLVGKRRHYITIAVPTRTSDSQGGYVTTWTDTYYEWAAVTFKTGSRSLDQSGIKYTKAIELIIRKHMDAGMDKYTLTPEHRIKFNGDYYTVHSVTFTDDKLNDLLVIAYA